MIRHVSSFLLVLLVSVDVFAAEPFYILAPDQKNSQLLSLSVRPVNNGVELKRGDSLPLPFRPTSTALHPNGKQLIVTSGGKGKSSAATIDILTAGKLRLMNSTLLEHPTGYTSIDRTGHYFLTVNYGSGTASVHRLQDNGNIGDSVCVVTTPNKEAHCVLTTRDNRFVYIPCVKNNNAMYQFSFDSGTGQLEPLTQFNARPPAMFGPRHVAYHPKLPIAYFSNEQQLGVSVYEIGSDGQLAATQHAVTMPRRTPYEQGKRDLHASDLVVTPNGQTLFVAVRDFAGDEDSIFTFRIESDGRLSQTHRTKVGDIPWKLDISPDGQHLIVSETGIMRLSVLKIHADGSLSSIASETVASGTRDFAVVKPQ